VMPRWHVPLIDHLRSAVCHRLFPQPHPAYVQNRCCANPQWPVADSPSIVTSPQGDAFTRPPNLWERMCGQRCRAGGTASMPVPAPLRRPA